MSISRAGLLPINSRVVYDSGQLSVIFQYEKQTEKVKGRAKGTTEILRAEKLKVMIIIIICLTFVEDQLQMVPFNGSFNKHNEIQPAPLHLAGRSSPMRPSGTVANPTE